VHVLCASLVLLLVDIDADVDHLEFARMSSAELADGLVILLQRLTRPLRREVEPNDLDAPEELAQIGRLPLPIDQPQPTQQRVRVLMMLRRSVAVSLLRRSVPAFSAGLSADVVAVVVEVAAGAKDEREVFALLELIVRPLSHAEVKEVVGPSMETEPSDG